MNKPRLMDDITKTEIIESLERHKNGLIPSTRPRTCTYLRNIAVLDEAIRIISELQDE